MASNNDVNTIKVPKAAVVPTASSSTVGDYVQIINPNSYINNREITNLPGVYLVKGSKNTIIVNREKVSSRLGYYVLGAGKTKNRGCHSSYDWETSENITRSLRMDDGGTLSVFYKGNWIALKQYAPMTRANFTTWWSATEITDFLLFGVGTPEVQIWSGAIGEIASSTSDTLTLKGYLNETTLALVAGTPATITDSGSNFLNAFYAVGDVITITISVTYANTTLAFVGPTTITDSSDGLAAAGIKVGDTISIAGSPTNSSDFVVVAVASDGSSLTVENADFTSEGAGASITIISNSPNNGTYIVSDVAAGTLTLSDGDSIVDEVAGRSVVIQRPNSTWGELGFLTADIEDSASSETQARSVIINGTTYYYSGGEGTGTLTGVSTVTGVNPGDIAVQSVIGIRPAALENFNIDLIGMVDNYVFYGNLKRRDILMSTEDDFTAFGFSTPRAPGEGGTFTLSSTPTAFVPDANDNMWFSARKNDWYELVFTLDATNGAEAINVNKITTATGQAAQSQGCVINIKNQVAFLTFEPTIDTLGRIPFVNTDQSVPLSFPIKNDLLAYNLKDAQGVYFQNQIFMTLPVEGIVLIYDLQNELWQPPQYLPVGRLALIDIDGSGIQVLCGHSSFGNETYVLFAPNTYDDNGAIIEFVVAFGYDNFGARFMEKNADEFATEIYMSHNTKIVNTVVYDYEGATDIRNFNILGSDESIRFAPRRAGGLGQNEFGSQPFGSLATPIEDLSKFRAIDCTPALDFFERQRIYSSDSKQARFSIIAYGENVEMADNIPAFIKR